MIAAMRFFTLALALEVDGSPAPSPPARRQAFFQKCTFDRRAVGAVVVPVGLAFHAPNASIAGRSSFKSRVTNWFQQLRSVYSGALSTTFEACKKVSTGSAASEGHDIFGRGD